MRSISTQSVPRLDLGQALEEYPLTTGGFIADRIMPVLNVPKKEGAFSVITRESILRARNVKRAKGSAYSRDSFDKDDVSYRCEEYGHEQILGDDEVAYYASEFDAEMVAAAMAASVVAREREKRVASAIFNATTWTGSTLYTDLATDWDNIASLPVNDVNTAKEKIRQNCGLAPNTMVISAAVVPWLKANTDLKARLAYVMALTDSAITGALAELFGIPNVLIAGAVYNTGGEGETFAGSDIWSDNYCWLGVVPQTPNPAEPGACRTMLWTGDSPSTFTVDTYREEQTRSNIYRVRHHVQEKVIDPNFAHLLLIDT